MSETVTLNRKIFERLVRRSLFQGYCASQLSKPGYERAKEEWDLVFKDKIQEHYNYYENAPDE